MRLEGKVAVITGGARGIGQCFASRFAAEGAKVGVADVLDASNTIEMIKNAGAEGFSILTDVSKESSVLEMTEQVVRKFGRIDILINNAGVIQDWIRKPFYEITEQEWDRVMAINVKGMFFCAKGTFPYMKEQGKGKIINLCSTTVFKGVPNFLHYVASKGAVAAFTRSLAREVGQYGINVNAVAPGLTISEIFLNAPRDYRDSRVIERAIKREEKPEDLVGTAVFLASEDSDFITGQIIVVDGGAAMR